MVWKPAGGGGSPGDHREAADRGGTHVIRAGFDLLVQAVLVLIPERGVPHQQDVEDDPWEGEDQKGLQHPPPSRMKRMDPWEGGDQKGLQPHGQERRGQEKSDSKESGHQRGSGRGAGALGGLTAGPQVHRLPVRVLAQHFRGEVSGCPCEACSPDTQTGTQTGRHTDTQTGTQTGRHTDTQIGTQTGTDRQADTQTHRQADRQAQTDREIQADAQRGRHTDRQTQRHSDRQTDTDRHTDRQRDTQTGRHTDGYTQADAYTRHTHRVGM